MVINLGIIDPLLEILKAPPSKVTMVRNVVWCISNLCRGKNPPPDFEKVGSRFFLLLVLVILYKKIQVKWGTKTDTQPQTYSDYFVKFDCPAHPIDDIITAVEEPCSLVPSCKQLVVL